MTRSRALNRFHRYLAHRHLQTLRSRITDAQAEWGGYQRLDVSKRLQRRALQRDQWLDGLEQEPAL
ncbi:hypothetical protein [Synechococcus sp. GEYO]|uniref:hypothetical protein n=1 Tax=Synechococcus sp. GEYO TaxID=2575511 RepID=UPI0010BCF21C|nr:hypothetical protein [Synechococcus sp. GEYO]